MYWSSEMDMYWSSILGVCADQLLEHVLVMYESLYSKSERDMPTHVLFQHWRMCSGQLLLEHVLEHVLVK